MRTREEQIIHAAQELISHRASGKFTEYYLVESIVDEAERRAEQRVRAEIGRDSERLDWLGQCCIHVYAPKKYDKGIGCGVCVLSHKPEVDRNLRAAIDAAMEGGNG